MSIPVFTPAPRPTYDNGSLKPSTEWPRCPCGSINVLDAQSGLCRECWIPCVLAKAFKPDAFYRSMMIAGRTEPIGWLPPMTSELSHCGGCGGESKPWLRFDRPAPGTCFWTWDVDDEAWLFTCADDRRDGRAPETVPGP